jgi:hypothetical protein
MLANNLGGLEFQKQNKNRGQYRKFEYRVFPALSL